ncbi:hypothetical protein [Vreelandella titanicae]|uniref:hypothetical protein n=1 Tax=Vreelandella titanicae TaxID=664683 RepID=UPI004043A825
MSNPNPVPPPPARGRPKGSRNAAVLANQALNEYRRNLLRAADAGDINAAGWLLTVDALERQKAAK